MSPLVRSERRLVPTGDWRPAWYDYPEQQRYVDQTVYTTRRTLAQPGPAELLLTVTYWPGVSSWFGDDQFAVYDSCQEAP